MNKRCKECKKIKPETAFYKNNKSKDKLEYRCKTCDLKRSNRSKFKKRYGISIPDKDKMIQDQNYLCKLCNDPLDLLETKFIHLDHDHKTKKIRGVLCAKCNRLLGWYENNKENILRYIPNDPFEVIKHFEIQVAKYSGAPYCVTLDSCTNALFLSLIYMKQKTAVPPTCIEIPKYTYIGVPMSIKNAGFNIIFRNEDWKGIYKLSPFPIYDAARRFTSNMYVEGTFMCTSHHWSKILGIQHGGCILHDDPIADAWLRRARFDGRTEGLEAHLDSPPHLGRHFPMPPENAAAGLVRLANLPAFNPDLPNSNYPDLSKMEVFK